MRKTKKTAITMNIQNKQKIWPYFCLIITFLIGLSLLFFGLTINALTNQVIENTGFALANGMPIQSILKPILGVLAKGYIINVPVWVALTSVFSGILLLYFSAGVLINMKNKLPAFSMFSMAYWRHFDLSFSYRPIRKNHD